VLVVPRIICGLRFDEKKEQPRCNRERQETDSRCVSLCIFLSLFSIGKKRKKREKRKKK